MTLTFEEVRAMRSRLADLGNQVPGSRHYSEVTHLRRDLCQEQRNCNHCGKIGTVVDHACYECVVLCSKAGCDNPADPGALGKMCPECMAWMLDIPTTVA